MTANQRTEKVQTRLSTKRKALKLEFEIPPPIMPDFQCSPLPPTDIPLLPYMPRPTTVPKLEGGWMGGIALPPNPMSIPIIVDAPLLQVRSEIPEQSWAPYSPNWPLMPKIKVTNKKTKRGRKKQKAEVMMFNPNLFPTLCGSVKDEFGFLNFANQVIGKKRTRQPKSLTMKEQRKRDTGSYVQVWRGVKKYTRGGLTKKDLVKNKKGRVVSRRQQSHNPLKKWVNACRQAKRELKIPGFCPLNKGDQGKALYKRAKEIYAEIKAKDKKAEEAKAEEVKAEENKAEESKAKQQKKETVDPPALKAEELDDNPVDKPSLKVNPKETFIADALGNSL